MKTILVTGATGFIGCHLLPVLHQQGWQTMHIPTSTPHRHKCPLLCVPNTQKPTFAYPNPNTTHTQWQKWRDPWSVNNLAVVAAIAAIEDRDFQQQTSRICLRIIFVS